MQGKEHERKIMHRHKRNSRRVCLRCSKEFASTGPGNRICNECKHATKDAYAAVRQSAGVSRRNFTSAGRGD